MTEFAAVHHPECNPECDGDRHYIDNGEVEATESVRDALFRADMEALRVTLPVIEASGSRTTTIDVRMLRRLYDAASAYDPDQVRRDQRAIAGELGHA